MDFLGGAEGYFPQPTFTHIVCKCARSKIKRVRILELSKMTIVDIWHADINDAIFIHSLRYQIHVIKKIRGMLNYMI